MEEKIEKTREVLLDRIIKLAPKAKAKDFYNLVLSFKTVQEKPFDAFGYIASVTKEIKNEKGKK